MRIKWLEPIELEVVENYDEQFDFVESTIEIFNEEDEIEIDIFGEEDESGDIQFEDGSLAFGVSKSWFQIKE